LLKRNSLGAEKLSKKGKESSGLIQTIFKITNLKLRWRIKKNCSINYGFFRKKVKLNSEFGKLVSEFSGFKENSQFSKIF